MDLQRTQTYLIDIEELLRMRDQHLQSLRGMQMEENLLGSDLLGGSFQEDRVKLLEQIKESRKEAGDAIKVVDNLLAALTPTPRETLVNLKVVLNRVAEAQAILAEITQTAEIEPESVSEDRIQITRDFYEKVKTQAENMVPKDYDPRANLIAQA